MKTELKKEGSRKRAGKAPTSVAFRVSLSDQAALFVHHGVVGKFTDILKTEAEKKGCVVPVYCYMPDHQHFIVTGGDAFDVADSYRKKTARWMTDNIPKFSWDDNVRDHVIEGKEILSEKVKHILDNPVRKGLVQSWEEYPFKGAIGCRIEDALKGSV